MEEFRFRWAPAYRAASAPFGVTPANSFVRVTDDELGVRFGPWTLRTPRTNVVGAEETGGYAFVRTAGPAHLSLADRGVTFATNAGPGLCLRFASPVRAIDPLGLLRHPGATVTVEDLAGLRRALGV